MLRERDIEKELKEAVEASGGLCYKWDDYEEESDNDEDDDEEEFE